jgi:hypothetical protein
MNWNSGGKCIFTGVPKVESVIILSVKTVTDLFIDIVDIIS